MKPFFLRIVILIAVVYFGFNSIAQEFGGYDIGLLGFLNNITLILLVILTVVSFVVDWSNFKEKNSMLQFSVTFIALIFCAIIFFRVIQREIIDGKNTMIEVSNLPGANNTLTFDFKEDNDFRLIEYNRVGQIIYYGKYAKRGDSIAIKESNYNGFAKALPVFGIVRNDTMFWNKFDTMLVIKK